MANYSYQITNNGTIPKEFTIDKQTVQIINGATINLTVNNPISYLPSDFTFYLVNPNGTLTLIQNASTIVQAVPSSDFNDLSGTTSTVAGKFTSITGPNKSRQYFRIINTSNAIIYLYDKNGTPSQSKCIPIQPNAGFVFDTRVTSTAIQVMSLTASCTFEAAEG